jgi:prophage regulatory protein
MKDATAVLAQAFHTDNSADNSLPRGNARFLRLSEVRRRVPYGRASIYRLIAAGQFPRPYSLGARAVAWLESDIDAWIESRIDKQQQAERQVRL